MSRRKTIKKSGSSNSGKSKKRKLRWIPMEVTRIPLNSEQAVLSCCETPDRGAVYAASGGQCLVSSGCGTVVWYTSS